MASSFEKLSSQILLESRIPRIALALTAVAVLAVLVVAYRAGIPFGPLFVVGVLILYFGLRVAMKWRALAVKYRPTGDSLPPKV